MAPIPTAVLDISTLVTRLHVRIDGALYPLRTYEEFTAIGDRHLRTKYQRVGALLGLPRLTKGQQRERAQLLADCCRSVLVAPVSVHAKLTDLHRMQVIAVFSQLLPTDRTGGARTNGTGPASPTGAKSSRG